MSESSSDDVSLRFAKKLHGETWEYLEKPGRTPAENERMIHAAHASCYHWLQVGTGLNHQRGEWLIARVYTVLGHAEPALWHANRCLELTDEYAEQMHDFDRAFAYEGAARANALAGNQGEARRYYELADAHGQAIQDAVDREYFLADLHGGNWFGLH